MRLKRKTRTRNEPIRLERKTRRTRKTKRARKTRLTRKMMGRVQSDAASNPM